VTVLAVADHRRGELREVSFELLTAGRQLADGTGSDLHAAVVSGPVEEYGRRLDREGVDVVHTVDYGEEFNHDVHVQALDQLADAIGAGYVLAPHSVNGLDYAPALATRRDLTLVTDVTGLDAGGELTVTRERYGGKTEAELGVAGEGAVITTRAGEWPAADGAGEATVQPFEVDIDEAAVRSTVTGFQEVGAGDVDIADADVIVAVGRGIGEEENLAIVEDLAEALGATLAASRPIVDNGWLPEDRQVGQSGTVVSPDIYLAVGISGAVQHVAGMKGADTIVAINDDPSAPIFEVADYGIVDDLFEVVPALTEQLQ